jgi:ATP-dependent helicase/nuclease subunit B
MGRVELLPGEIAAGLGRGATVLTGNQRAARTLRQAYDRRNKELGLERWQPPAVMAWDTWTAKLWHELLVGGGASRLLLSPVQEHAVWRDVLETDAERSLRSKDSLAETAADAWSRLCRYEGQGLLGRVAVSSDTRAFQRWAMGFQSRCRDRGLLSRAELERSLRAAVESGAFRHVASEIMLVGFDEMTPAQARLVTALQAAGHKIHDVPLQVTTEKRMLVEAADEYEELHVAARWMRRFLEERPAARIAVVVPGLEEKRARIDRVFREVLAPELERIDSGDAGPFEFSLGVKLGQTPLVMVALTVLKWACEPLPLERVSWLLTSPYFSMVSEERNARAEFDAFELRRSKLLRPEITLSWLTRRVEGSKRRKKLEGLSATLRKMQQFVATRLEGTHKQSYSEWAERMRELLRAAGLGTGTVGSSVRFQTHAKWESALDELATLDFDGARVGYADALGALERIAQETLFAPESREAPVQVMGPLEAAGSTFDAVWFSGAGDLSWPAVSGGTPLLPRQIQRKLGIPGNDVARDSENARAVTRRIADAGGSAIFSYAKESAEGRQRPSHVLDGLGLEVTMAGLLAGETRERTEVELEEVPDDDAIAPLPDRVAHGGVQILKLQAACGFRAFAEFRLRSTELESAELGLDARERGTVIHEILGSFWDEVKTQRELRLMPPLVRAETLERHIANGLQKLRTYAETSWDDAYMEIQRERLKELLGAWLEFELGRSPFEVKLSEQKLEDQRIGPLRLNVRVDRVDRVAGGNVVIDYKTGAASPKDWLTDRPDAPQLPLYAVLSDADELRGVAFGMVRAGDDMGFEGYADLADILPGRYAKAFPLGAQVDEWRRTLTGLAEQFCSGSAEVAPKSYPETCRHCAQRILCRLDTSQIEDEADSDTETIGG